MADMKQKLFNSLSRAKQFTGEKLGKAEKTAYDSQFESQLNQIDVVKSQTEKILKHATSWLEPNPNRRLEANFRQRLKRPSAQKMTEIEALGHSLHEASESLNNDSTYAKALSDVGTVQIELGERWHHLTAVVMERFHTPMKTFVSKDIKEILAEKRALNKARLDLDAAKARAKKAEATPDRLQAAQDDLSEKQASFDRQYETVKMLLENAERANNEHIHRLAALVDAQHGYFAAAAEATAKLSRDIRAMAGLEPPSYSSTNPVANQATAAQVTASDLSTAKVLCNFETDNGLSLVADDVVIVVEANAEEDTHIIEKAGKTAKVPSEVLELE